MSHEDIKAVIDTAPVVSVKEDITTTITRLSMLPPLEYERVRDSEAERLGVRVAALDKEVLANRKSLQQDDDAMMFSVVPVWPEPVDLEILLDEVATTVQRFIICEKETAIATALWCAFTWVIDDVQVAPLAVITAPEKRCGKSQLLNLIGKLVPKPLVASNISPSATFRVIEAYRPTLLIDEADTFFKDNEELRGVINSGHTRQSAYVIRSVGDDHEPKQFSTWGAKAISGIGTLADTIMDRAIILTLRRKLPHEAVKRLRHAEAGTFEVLASKLARFAQDYGDTVARSRPPLPEALNDRAQDNWEPLLAIADCAGGKWPELARNTALTLSSAEHESPSLSAELLSDIKKVFEYKLTDRISTTELITALCKDEEKPWATYNRGKQLSSRQLSKQLSEYGIASKSMRIEGVVSRGFELQQFSDAFARYLTSTPLESATLLQSSFSEPYTVADNVQCNIYKNESSTLEAAEILNCNNVADKSGVVEVRI